MYGVLLSNLITGLSVVMHPSDVARIKHTSDSLGDPAKEWRGVFWVKSTHAVMTHVAQKVLLLPVLLQAGKTGKGTAASVTGGRFAACKCL